ncbi:Gfo/Idh/MocA family protein [Rubinisphaera brasiliensis]|uniref:Oxidoreductase domain protein n=1 Tax=Rubinisphaera brasiliensis (strain ATCC 49424 / DSM 5305 / JCM 21570 / IAM 15109 / NBRC 103401 / IFAM 1448) TaxID=756272 RepID=F0SP12_RUBBR|nr:Gfo/Idh/MocA family oxidoreductase [Rubinisphaera brasiliensis]ADY60088.1 oxidoreductase domain protein [Rubinisphaera brasiliensis DSM 5305]
MNDSQQPSRRSILKSTAAAAASFAALPSMVPSLAHAKAVSANEKINLGVIGIGPRCRYDLTAMLKFDDIRCVAIADVQQSRREAGKKLVDDHYGDSRCELEQDFRALLDRDDIDAVLIATGDRWHSPASILAAEAGKDVYSEKPCGITIEACQQLADTINRTGRVFQAGTQRRSVPNFARAVEMVHTGQLGKLKRMHASVYRPTLDNTWLPGEPTPPQEVVDWNMWLGPAPWRPYNQKYVNGRWRGQWDFDSGARLLDWGAHTVDICQWANQADDTMPISYEPQKDRILCRYANGVELHIDFLDDPFRDRAPHFITRLGTCPVRFVGEKGWIETGDEGEIAASSDELLKAVGSQHDRVRGLDVSAHARDFFDCIRSGNKPAANADVMRRSHIASHAAANAWILQRKLTIDPKTETFDDAEANLLASRPQRDWEAGAK